MKKKILIGTLAITLLSGCSNNTQEVTPLPVPDDLAKSVVESIECDECLCLVDPDDLLPPFELSDEERRVVENIVMGEAEGESWDGKVLVAQCILNAALKDGIQPSEVRTKYKYSGWNENPSYEVKMVVTAVFDNGHTVTDEPILYFYAPKYSEGRFHETQCYVLTEGGHKFFKEWS